MGKDLSVHLMQHDLSHLGSLILIRIIPKERTLRNLRNISSGFFENQPNEICSYSSEKASKSRFLKPEKLQNHRNERKGKEKRKSEEDERRRRGKNNGCVFSFYNGYSGDCLFVAGMFNSCISNYSLKVKVSED